MNEGLEHIDDLIAKILTGEASGAEIDSLEGWMNASAENKIYFEETKKLFAQIDSFKIEHNVNTVKAWDKLNARISSQEKINTEAKVVRLFQRPVFRIAASIMLIATLALLVNYYFNSQAPVPFILAAEKQIKTQSLPDGTKVTLNKNSELVYVVNDKKNVREVKLKGEAYFEVNKGDLPFEITIEDIIIKDIGTAFNVKALTESNVVEVLVESGEVHFYTTSNEGVSLVKGEKAFYNKTSKQFSKVVSDPVENTLSYKSKAFRFKETPMRDVITQLNAIYDSNIVLDDERLGNCRLTTMFNESSVDAIVEIIAETLDFEVQRSGGKIIFKGRPCAE